MNKITAVAVNQTSLAVGTASGTVFVHNIDTKNRGDHYKPIKYTAHSKAITGIWLKHQTSLITVSEDSKFFIKHLGRSPDKKDDYIDISKHNLLELTCVDVMNNKCEADDLECLIGTLSGKLVRIQKEKGGLLSGLWSSDLIFEVLFQPKDSEGKVMSVAYKSNLAIWATPKQIRVMHFNKVT